MALQKYRADRVGSPYPVSGAIPWYCDWMGGRTLAKIVKCPTPFGPRTVYITGEADTWFSLPAACVFKGKPVRGWVEFEDGEPVFHAMNRQWVYPRSDFNTQTGRFEPCDE